MRIKIRESRNSMQRPMTACVTIYTLKIAQEWLYRKMSIKSIKVNQTSS